jgi:hypothetical protein
VAGGRPYKGVCLRSLLSSIVVALLVKDAKKRLAIVLLALGMMLSHMIVVAGNSPNSVTQPSGTLVQEPSGASDDFVDDDLDLSTPLRLEIDVDVTETDYRLPVDAPWRSAPGARDRVTYEKVIDQFAAEENPRYRPRHDSRASYDIGNRTYCNIFVWDITRAMGVEIPLWVIEGGEPVEPLFTQKGWLIPKPAYWLAANGFNQWLNQAGPLYGWRKVSAEEAQGWVNLGYPTVVHGWRKVSAEEAQGWANLGYPAVASVYEPEGFGHVGIVRPGEALNGPALAQAGTSNVNHAHVYDFFPREGTEFFVNDRGNGGDNLPA